MMMIPMIPITNEPVFCDDQKMPLISSHCPKKASHLVKPFKSIIQVSHTKTGEQTGEELFISNKISIISQMGVS